MGSTRLGPSNFAGHWLVLVFWADWCGPCHAEQPGLSALASRLSPKVAFLGVDYNDDRAAAASFMGYYHVPYPSLFDPGGRVMALYAVPTIPYFIVISPQGRIRFRFQGELGASSLELELRRLGAIPAQLRVPSGTTSKSKARAEGHLGTLESDLGRGQAPPA